MNRSTPMKRTAFKPKGYEPRPAKVYEVHTARSRPVAVAVTDTRARMVVPVPKRQYVRNAKLREAYRDLPCQFDRDGGLCARMDGTVCCCHSNWGQHGKGLSIKADDSRAAAGCSQCHAELDQGKRWTEAEKRTRWQAAHERSVRLLVSMGLWPAGVAVPEFSTGQEATTEGV